MNDQPNGVPMICATPVMKPGRARIGKIGGNLTLPRTVPIVTLIAALVGALLGLVISLGASGGTDGIAVGIGLGGGAGWLVVTYSPLKNESLLKWFELQFKSQTRTRYVNGRRVIVAVGTAVIPAPSSGPVILARSAAKVPPGHYDERGAVRSARNMNLDGDHVDLAALRGSTVPHAGAIALPADAPESETPTRRQKKEARTSTSLPAGSNTPTQARHATRAPTDPFDGPVRKLKD